MNPIAVRAGNIIPGNYVSPRINKFLDRHGFKD